MAAEPGAARIVRGVPSKHRADAAALLYDAFTLKIDHDLKPRTREQAERIIAASLDPRAAYAAVEPGGRLVGLLGLGMGRRERFSHITFRLLATEFGLFGALPRWFRVILEDALVPRGRVAYVEALAVAEDARGRGIGTALLEAAIDEATRRGASAVVLEVVDTNPAARRLYERLGFERAWGVRTGALTAGGGFKGFDRMRRRL